MFSRANVVISVLVASVASGAATLLFARAFGFGPVHDVWKRTLRCAPMLIAAALLVAAILFGITALGTLVPREVTAQGFAARWGVRGTTLILFILVQSFFAYTTAWIILMGHKIGPAIRDSFRVTLRTFLPTVIAVAVPLLIHFPFSYASSRVDLIAGKLRPEVVGSFLSVQIVCQLLITFLLVGAVTRLFLWRVEATR
jgi:hypothetical protein